MQLMTIQSVFILGLVCLLILGIWFFKSRNTNQHYQTASLVLMVTALAYAVMLYQSFSTNFITGEQVYFVRWFFYIISCSLLMFTMTKLLKTPKTDILPIIVLNGLVMLSGGLTALMDTPLKWLVFGLGCVFYILQMKLIFIDRQNNHIKFVMPYIIFGWSVFPIIFILAPEGVGVISNLVAASLYLILDIYTKVVFYLHLGEART